MNQIEVEVIDRAIRWCAEAGRQVTASQVEAALAPLPWDTLLVVKALLSDPPPARPLGPYALVDIARGAPPPIAAEREREGRYLEEAVFDSKKGPPAAPDEGATRGTRRKKVKAPRAAAIRVRRASERSTPIDSTPPLLPLLEELRLPEGRATLERFIREYGPRRATITAALTAGWRRADGAVLSEDDLATLLHEHGLDRAFERRERTLLLHALRTASGSRPRAGFQLGLSTELFQKAVERLGIQEEAESIRDEWRRDVKRRATLSERVRLLMGDEERLADLGLLPEVLADLRVRLPDHIKALRAAHVGPLAPALGRSLSLSRSGIDILARRFNLALGDRPSSAAPAERRETGRPGVRPRDEGHPPRRRPPVRPARGPRDRRRP